MPLIFTHTHGSRPGGLDVGSVFLSSKRVDVAVMKVLAVMQQVLVRHALGYGVIWLMAATVVLLEVLI